MKYKRGIIFIVIILLLYFTSSYAPPIKGIVGKAIAEDNSKNFSFENAILTRVVDGDTIEALVGMKPGKYALMA